MHVNMARPSRCGAQCKT